MIFDCFKEGSNCNDGNLVSNASSYMGSVGSKDDRVDPLDDLEPMLV